MARDESGEGGSAGEGRYLRLLATAAASIAVLVALKGASAYALHSPKDMRRLAAASAAVGGPGTQVQLFEEEALYGLDFYLDGAVQRVSATGAEPWADASLDRSLAELRANQAAHSYVFIANGTNAPELEQALRRAGIPFTRFRDRGHALFRVGG